MEAFLGWVKSRSRNVSLDAGGFVALADLSTVARRTALTGTSTLLDCFVLCPGLHRQQNAVDLNGGEFPAVAAMTTGYVFRVENPATVVYLQKVGRTGQLTTVEVSSNSEHSRLLYRILEILFSYQSSSYLSGLTYIIAVSTTITALVLLRLAENWWALTVASIWIFARFCNVVVIRRRAQVGWKGAAEPGVHGDLLVLLSQDRWIRIRGLVDDLKAVASGQWLREKTFLESSVVALATMLVYLDAALASNVDQSGKLVLLLLLISGAGLLGIANEWTEEQQVHGRVLKVKYPRQTYGRRLEMARQLIKETGRQDWAMRLGMIVPEQEEGKAKAEREDMQGVTV